MKRKTKSPLPYFGSDAAVAAELGALLGDCSHVTVPFVGGASIIPHLDARGIVGNDRNNLAINFYRVLSGDDRGDLIERCQRTLSHPAEVVNARATLVDPFALRVELAWAYWSVCWIGRKGAGGTRRHIETAKAPSVRWTAIGGNNASRIQTAADELDAWAGEFQRVEWLSLDFRDVLGKVNDVEGCGVYCDPPWIGAGANYVHAFTDQDHDDLARALARFTNARVVLRYDNCDEVRRRYPGAFWFARVIETRTQANTKLDEVWISNRPVD